MASLDDFITVSSSAPHVPSEEEIIANCKPDTLYVHPTGEKGKYLNFHVDDKFGEIELSPRVRLSLYYVKDKNDVEGFKIVKIKRRKDSWIPEKDSEVSFSVFTMAKIRQFLELLTQMDIPSISKGRIELLSDVGNDPELLKKLITIAATTKGKEALMKLLETGISDEDFVNIAYRKEQLSVFEQLLSNQEFFKQYEKEHGIKKGTEAVWQYFFERNAWIFGYGLNYVWCTGADDDRLEQVVSGFTFNESGKRTDALLKTASAVRQFVLVEIKTPDTKLLEEKSYRPEVWMPGHHVVGGVAQSQKTVMLFKEKFFRKSELKEKDGTPKGETVYNFTPRSYLLVGNLEQFIADTGLNEDKYSSFEVYRNSIVTPEIITYDELLSRAKAIVRDKGIT